MRLHPLALFLIPFCALASAPLAQAAPAFLDDEAEASTDVSWTMPKPGAAQTLVFDYQDAKNFYALESSPASVAFTLTKNGVKRTLASAPVNWDGQNSVVLQRRPWLMQLIVNDEIALRGFDAAWTQGKIGAAPAGWTEMRVQPLEEVRFDDDFTRTGDAGDEVWKVDSGKWRLSAASSKINDRTVNMSSNPFAYQVVMPNGAALATAGRWFWDSYDARVAVRPAGSGQVGVAAYVKDPKNYLAFVWSSEEGANARQLVRVENGKTTVLASGKGAFISRQWYKIGLRTSPGYIEAIVDGVPVLRAANEALGQGGVGLLAKNIEAAEFDDVVVRSYDFLRTAFAENGAWERATGKWTLAGGVAKGANDGANAPNLLVTGARDWDAYRAHISAQLVPGATLGYAVGVRDSKNYTLFQVTPGQEARISRVENGAAKTLFQGPADIQESDGQKFARFQIDARNGALTVRAGTQLIAQASAPNLTKGRFGLMTQGAAPVAFKDAVIYFPPPADAPKVAAKMEDDPFMVGWASASGEWPPVPGDKGLEFWNAGDFFGDTTLSFPWRASWRGNFEIALRAKRPDFGSGYLLQAVANTTDDPKAKTLDWKLIRGGKTLASATMKLSDLPGADSPDGGNFQLQLAGNGLMLLAGETPVLSYLDPNAPAGTAMAVRSSGFRVRADKMVATSANRDDYTFTEAPVDFYAPSGKWNVFSRWPCYGDWSFFGGTGRHPTLWSKRIYSGDVVAEFYAHPQMDLPKEPGYSHPGDLNISICGDGKNPASGYSFIVAGDNNTVTQIRRGSKIVAERSDDKAWFHNTINHVPSWHRTWFFIRAQARAATQGGKDGVLVSLSVNDDKLLEYFDPDPLPGYTEGGRVAFWTLDSTMMIARAKIEAAKLGTRALPQGLIEAAYVNDAETRPATSELMPMAVAENDVKTAVVERAKNGWEISNPVSGGIFSVDLNGAPLAATSATKFTMKAAIPNDVKIDLYAQIDGQWHTIKLTSDQKPDAMAPTLGKAEVAGESYSFDLGAALAKAFPGQKNWKIETLRLGAMQGDPYRWVGFYGNGMDASYLIESLGLK